MSSSTTSNCRPINKQRRPISNIECKGAKSQRAILRSTESMKGAMPELDGCAVLTPREAKNLRQDYFSVFKEKLQEHANLKYKNQYYLIGYFTNCKKMEMPKPKDLEEECSLTNEATWEQQAKTCAKDIAI